jgi:hypothetical protein
MSHFSAEAKHHILLEYRADDASRSFAALARRHGVKGGHETVRQWWLRWDGTPASMQRKAGTGKKPLLSLAQIKRHIATPIRNANRGHRSISYTSLLPQVQAATGKQLSLRTLQGYGKKELGGRQVTTRKRTADESKRTETGMEE